MTDWVGVEIAGAVLNGIIEGVALCALLWLLLRLTPKTAAATRYALCGLTLAFVAALPIIEGWLPRLSAPAAAPLGTGHSGAALTLTAGAWLVWALGAWAFGSLTLMARLAWGFVGLCGLKRRAVAAPAGVGARFEGIMRACPGRRRASVLISSEVAAPMAAGVVKPAVLLPAFLVEDLSAAELDQVLTHELAHLRRWDDWSNLAQKVVEALLFFHPAVIWIGRRLTLEREIACDDWVVQWMGAARPYATCLTRLAVLRAATPQLAPGALAPKPQLSIRVEALLAGGRDRRRRSSRGALAAAAITLALAAFAAAPLAPVTVAPPAVSKLAHRPAPVVANAALEPAPAREPVRRVRVHRQTSHVVPALQASVQEPTRRVETRATIEPAVLRPAAPDVMLYVLYVDGGDAGWIRILWIHEVPAPVLNGT